MAYDRFIGIRVLESTKTFVKDAATAKSQSLSDFVRNSIIREARKTLVNNTTETEEEVE